MQKSFEYKAAKISYRIIGEGKPIMLLHGFGEDSTIFNEQIEFLKSSYKLIVPDLPGSGLSDLLQGEVSIDDYASCINALLLQENIDSCCMLGHSMGGYITLAFAELYPRLLSSFGFIHSTAFADSEEKKATRLKGIETIEKYGAFPFLKTTTPNLFGKRFKEEQPEKIEALIEAGKQFTKEALQQYYAAMMNRPDRTNVLKGNPLPVLFVLGTEDVAAPLHDVLQQTHLPQVSHVHILQGVGHMSMWESTEQLNKHLLNFIEMQ